MVEMSKLPNVIIIGRPNVGKSTLFNRLIGRRQAIVSTRPGTTRDLVKGMVSWRDRNFELIDTAGLDKTSGEIEQAATERIYAGMAESAAIILLVDGTTSLNEYERQLARQALKSGKSVLLAVNKSDQGKLLQDPDKFKQLGIKEIIQISAINGAGCGDLLDRIASLIPKHQHRPADNQIRVAILGRPNAGKTSLLNRLSSSSEAIVSSIAGTTRDINYATVKYQGRELLLADTAGLRKPGKLGRDIEYFSSLRTKKAIADSDVCIVLVEHNEPVTSQDQRIAGMIKDAGKGAIVVVTKWDAAEGKDSHLMSALAGKISADYQFLSWAPLIFISSQTGQNIEKLKELIVEIADRRLTKISTAKLNTLLNKSIARQAPAGIKNIRPKLNYITQTGTNPPEFTIFSSHPEAVHFSYLRYLENNLRQAYDFVGTPVILELRSKRK